MRIQHVTLMVDDIHAAEDFYVGELGLEIIPKEGLDYPGLFLRMNDSQELHLAEMADVRSFRGHFCLRVRNFNTVFYRMRELAALDLRPWGKVRELDGGVMQFYVRDPAGNLVEICSEPEDRGEIDAGIMELPEWGGVPYRHKK